MVQEGAVHRVEEVLDGVAPRHLPLRVAQDRVGAGFGERLGERQLGTDAILCYAEWEVPWRYAVENLLDPMHGAFLHHDSHTMYDGDTTAKFRIRETDRGYFFEKTDQRGVNFDWVELCHTGIDWVDLSIPYPPSAGPGGPFGIVGMVCRSTSSAAVSSSGATAGSRAGSATPGASSTRPSSRSATGMLDGTMLEAMPTDADQRDLGVAVRLAACTGRPRRRGATWRGAGTSTPAPAPRTPSLPT